MVSGAGVGLRRRSHRSGTEETTGITPEQRKNEQQITPLGTWNLETSFTHLHVHSNFSFLDGATPPERLLERAAELGMPALALTDHHGLYGAVRFMQAAAGYGVRPIVGVEIEVQSSMFKVQSNVQRSTFDIQRKAQGRNRHERRNQTPENKPNLELGTWNLELPRFHLILLAKNRAGYASLCRIVTKAQLDHQDDPHIALTIWLRWP